MRYSALTLLLCVLLCACGTAGQGSRTATDGDDTVNIGFGRTSRQSVTGSVSKVRMNQRNTYTNMYDYLRGRVAGVQVSGTSIYIRGISSVNSGTEALVLVNGVETHDLSTINPNDVKSVEVRKDSAASIYGVRGANGVILITTE